MTARQFRSMLTMQPFRQFLVKTSDGDTHRVEHQDYALISPSNTEVVIYDKDIVSLEPVRNGSKKPGKR